MESHPVQLHLFDYALFTKVIGCGLDRISYPCAVFLVGFDPQQQSGIFLDPFNLRQEHSASFVTFIAFASTIPPT
jgi:hypothetical protein